VNRLNSFLLQHYLHEPTSRDSGKQAVTDGSRSISYGELSFLSNQLAHCLKANGVSRQGHVLVVQQRSVDFLIAVLGILKSDAVYIPLDRKSPLERWTSILRDAVPKAIIADRTTLKTARTALENTGSKIPILSLDSCHELHVDLADEVLGMDTICACDDSEPVTLNHADDLAYILYTSGSTGPPKGVMISHANVDAYIRWATDCFSMGAADRILGTAPFHFDMSTFDIYCALKTGATLCIANDMQTLFPEKLISYIEQQQITVWKGVASLLMYLARTGSLRSGAMPTLRQVLFAGEALPTKYLIDWMQAYPDKIFYNAYGPTEATGVSTCYRVDAIPTDARARIPIGTPRRGVGVVLLNEDGSEVRHGETGEICLTGDGLSKGYLNDPLKTARSFIPNPLQRSGTTIYKTGDLGRQLPDGNLDYLGRKDRQFKFMGYRIEAGEIERALLSVSDIKDAAVMLLDSRISAGMTELVAFCEVDGNFDVMTVSNRLKNILPPYMIPKRLVRVDQMPRCSRGKIAWDALKEHYQTVGSR